MRDKQLLYLTIIFICVISSISFELSETFKAKKIRVSFPIKADKMSNITSLEWNTLAQLISQAENMYSSSQLNQIARHIFQGMQKIQPLQHWSVYVFSSSTERAAFDGWATYNKFFWKINYGKYNLTYVSFAHVQCYGPLSGGGIAQFGDSVQSVDRDKIRQLVKSSIIYRGDDIQGAAQYIKTKLGQNVLGFWDVVVTSPTTKMGCYECRFKQWWASLKEFGDFKWNYYMSKN